MSEAQNENQSNATIVDGTKVSTPVIYITPKAHEQLRLIIENDFTLNGKYLRLLISGKGCEGFNYSVGFTDWNTDDMLIKANGSDNTPTDIQFVMDPFTAFYLQKCSVDYVEDFANNNEGFIVANENQKTFSGKFWKKDEQKVPPTLSR